MVGGGAKSKWLRIAIIEMTVTLVEMKQSASQAGDACYKFTKSYGGGRDMGFVFLFV